MSEPRDMGASSPDAPTGSVSEVTVDYIEIYDPRTEWADDGWFEDFA